MAAQWNTYFLEPLAIGGAGLLTAAVVDPVVLGDADGVRAFIGPVAATSEADTNASLQAVDLLLQPSGEWSACFWGAPRTSGQVLSWFVKLAGVWSPGPVVSTIDLSPNGTSEFPWVLDWLVDRLQEIAADRPFSSYTVPPVGDGFPQVNSRFLQIRRTYPRDLLGWPMISVQLDSLSPVAQFLGESEGVIGSTKTEGRVWAASLSLVGWCEKPEDRSRVGQWIGEAMAIVLDVAAYAGMSEPTYSLSETEDFETLGVPAFLVNASFSCQLESRRSVQVRSGYGRIALGTGPFPPAPTVIPPTVLM